MNQLNSVSYPPQSSSTSQSRTAPKDPLAGSSSTASRASPSPEKSRQTRRADRSQAWAPPPPTESACWATTTSSQISKRGRPADSSMSRIGCSSPPAPAALAWPRAPSGLPGKARRRSLAGFLPPGPRRPFGAQSLPNPKDYKNAPVRPNGAPIYGNETTHSAPLGCIESTPIRP